MALRVGNVREPRRRPERGLAPPTVRDITKHKRTAEALRRSTESDAFRVALVDALSTLIDPVQIQAAMRVPGERLRVDRVHFAEIEADDETSFERLRAVERLRRRAAHHIERKYRCGSGAVQRVGHRQGHRRPADKGRRWVANLGVHHGTARETGEDDIAMLEKTPNGRRPRSSAPAPKQRCAGAKSVCRRRSRSIPWACSSSTSTDDRRERGVRSNDGLQSRRTARLLSWEDHTPPEFEAATDRAAKECVTRGESATYEKQLLRKDGLRWLGLCAPRSFSGSGRQAECVRSSFWISQSASAWRPRGRA